MNTSASSRIHKILQLIPWLMIVVRIFIALVWVIDSLIGFNKKLFLPALVLAFTFDIFDGVIARNLGVVSNYLRRADSLADISFFYSVIFSAWLIHGELIKPFSGLLAVMFGLQVIAIVIAVIKYKAIPAYHTWSSRIAGVLLFIAAIQLFVFRNAGYLLLFALLAVCVSCLDSISITLILSKPSSDIPGTWNALKIRNR